MLERFHPFADTEHVVVCFGGLDKLGRKLRTSQEDLLGLDEQLERLELYQNKRARQLSAGEHTSGSAWTKGYFVLERWGKAEDVDA